MDDFIICACICAPLWSIAFSLIKISYYLRDIAKRDVVDGGEG